MSKTLILHAGLHKTGTTSIQNTCSQNVDELAKAGYWYPLFLTSEMRGVNKQSALQNHSKLIAQMFADTRRKWGTNSVDETMPNTVKPRIREEFLSEYEKALQKNIIISAERCSILTSKELRDMKEWFSNQGFNIKVLVVVRKPLAWLNSQVSQLICGILGPRLTLDYIISDFVKARGIMVPRIKNLLSVFPEAELLSFEEIAQSNESLPECFFHKIGIPTTRMTMAEVANTGRSNHSARINDEINRIFGHRLQNEENLKFFGTLHRRYPLVFRLPGEKFNLTRSELEPLEEVIRGENTWLKEHLGEKFCDDNLTLTDAISPLDANSRVRLQRMAARGGPRMQQVVQNYLARN